MLDFIPLFFAFIAAALVIFPPLTVLYMRRFPPKPKAKKRLDKRGKKAKIIHKKSNFRTPKPKKEWSY